MRKLVYFTTSFPYGLGENWKFNELTIFREYFDEIVVAPLSYGGNQSPRDVPQGIRVLEPLIQQEFVPLKKTNLTQLFTPRLVKHLSALRYIPTTNISSHAHRWCIAALQVERILRAPRFINDILPELQDAFLYFFWARGYAEILPFLPQDTRARSIVRFHGYDLYWERNGGYIPTQSLVAHSAAVLAPISETGAQYLASHYPSLSRKIFPRRLGTPPGPLTRPSNDGVFRIITCAFASPVKRLHLIPEALKFTELRIEWTHIGDGPEMDRVTDLASSLPSNVTTKFVGKLAATQVPSFYGNDAFDLFLNVSSSEGIPVSIMEALAAGLPVLATAVGGNPEIVDDSVGCLLSSDPSPEEIANRIESFAALPSTNVDRMREACVTRFKERFDAHANAREMAETILSLETSGDPMLRSSI